MNPLVSIITPSYNQAAYLADTIRSVLAQDYSPIEYWVIDGASTDGSIEVIRQFSSQLAGWISEPDSGQAEAINKGISKTSGEIVAWLNSDDFYMPSAVSQAVGSLQSTTNAGLVYGDALTVDQHGWPLKRLTFGKWGIEELVKFRVICQPAVFMRRSTLDDVGFLDPSYHYMLDHHLWIRIAQIAPVVYTGTGPAGKNMHAIPLAAARHHGGAKNVSQSTGFSQEILRILAWMHSVPNIERIIQENPNGVQAGAYRLCARYLLDGGRYREALGNYAKAARASPGYALKHWHRMVYATLASLGGKELLDRIRLPFTHRRQRQLAEQLASIGKASGMRLEEWPGICLRHE